MKRTKLLTFIMDNNVFQSVAREINFFYRHNLISDADLEGLKNELLDLINSLESWTTNGVSKLGTEVVMYISYVDIGASYIYIECDGVRSSNIRIYAITSLDSQNNVVCDLQKKWIESLKKFSVIISVSGEIQRYKYFNKQREIINFLGKSV